MRLSTGLYRAACTANHIGALASGLSAGAVTDTDDHRCVECGRLWDGVERGWQRHRVDHETALYCPDCAEREFGDR